MAKIIKINPTPSSDAMWFVLDIKTIGENPYAYWTSGDVAKKSSYIAGQIFDLNKKLGDVIQQVGIVKYKDESDPMNNGCDAFAVTKTSDSDWGDIEDPKSLLRQITRTINVLLTLPANARMLVNYKNYELFNTDQKLLHAQILKEQPEIGAVGAGIAVFLKLYVEPYLVGDGGHIKVKSYNPKTKTVEIDLLGGCAACTEERPKTEESIRNTLSHEKFEDVISAVKFVPAPIKHDHQARLVAH